MFQNAPPFHLIYPVQRKFEFPQTMSEKLGAIDKLLKELKKDDSKSLILTKHEVNLEIGSENDHPKPYTLENITTDFTKDNVKEIQI